jgi:hypothetical protein
MQTARRVVQDSPLYGKWMVLQFSKENQLEEGAA